MKASTGVLLFALLFCTMGIATGAPPTRPLAERLTPEQLRETGLDGLTSDQLAALDRILAEEASAAGATRAASGARIADAAREDRAEIRVRLAGEFRGWRGGQQFTFDNGETWRVVDTAEYWVPKSKTESSPVAILVPGVAGAWYLRFEGHSPRAKVQRVR